ncbi:hypothetical protein [Steroidobacter sp.]|uniref:hypothetical protein n=1 Tax=Steroidobacter sp. TaxID=1978227 RepID=UPI001A3FD4FF|nr:hypothetical protein [Steroidobacter sp.]MBL8269192.1 hypothetical protein [Steroidobacter sp.]
MSSPSQIPSQWTLVDADPGLRSATLQPNQVVWPARRCENLSALLSGLAPNRDHNADLAQRLADLPDRGKSRSPLFAIFAADPFIGGTGLMTALRAKGYDRVINWPTTSQYGEHFGGTLDSVNLGVRQECETLQRFSKQGYRVSIAVALPEAVAAFDGLQPEAVFVAPGFDLWKKSGRFDVARMLRRCSAIAAVVASAVPVILMADRGKVSMEQAKSAGASGVLLA